MNTDESITFSLAVEELVYMNDISYMDAIILHCEKTGMEIEVAASMLSNNLKSKIKREAESLHFLPKSDENKLPF